MKFDDSSGWLEVVDEHDEKLRSLWNIKLELFFYFANNNRLIMPVFNFNFLPPELAFGPKITDSNSIGRKRAEETRRWLSKKSTEHTTQTQNNNSWSSIRLLDHHGRAIDNDKSNVA